MTRVYFAFATGMTAERRLGAFLDACESTLEPPSFLAAYPSSLRKFTELAADPPRPFVFMDSVIDSGAFSAFTQGITIDLPDFIDKCRAARDDPRFRITGIFALDVIGDWRASLRNTEAMWRAGIEAIPCYHIGEPIDVLIGYAKDYPRVALGGIAKRPHRQRLNFLTRSFEAIWPKKIHGFGVTSKRLLMTFPFHTVDSSGWSSGQRFRSYSGLQRTVFPNSSTSNPVTGEMIHYQKIAAEARSRWARELALLEE